MKHQTMLTIPLVAVILATLLPSLAIAQDEGTRSDRPSGAFASYLYSSFSDPIYRGPGESGEVSVAQSTSGPGFQLGYLYLGDSFGGGVCVTYWQMMEFNSFRAQTMPGSSSYVSYKNPHYSLWLVDVQAHWLPTKLHASIYCVLGLGSNSESYTISGAVEPFADWNGSKDISSFLYSYGFGLQIFPFRSVSVHAEYRLIPGVTAAEAGDFLYSREGYEYYKVKDVETKRHTGVISLGISIGGLW